MRSIHPSFVGTQAIRDIITRSPAQVVKNLIQPLPPTALYCFALFKHFLRRKIASDRTGFRDIVAAESAFLAQKATIDYCRARAGGNAVRLFEEADFVALLERARWEAFAAVLGDVLTVAEAELRLHFGGQHMLLHSALTGLFRDILAPHPPPHRVDGWGAAESDFAERLARAQLAAPQPAEQIARASAARIFAVLPIHERLRQLDQDVVDGSLRFGMIALRDKLIRQTDFAAVAAALIAGEATSAGSA